MTMLALTIIAHSLHIVNETLGNNVFNEGTVGGRSGLTSYVYSLRFVDRNKPQDKKRTNPTHLQ